MIQRKVVCLVPLFKETETVHPPVLLTVMTRRQKETKKRVGSPPDPSRATVEARTPGVSSGAHSGGRAHLPTLLTCQQCLVATALGGGTARLRRGKEALPEFKNVNLKICLNVSWQQIWLCLSFLHFLWLFYDFISIHVRELISSSISQTRTIWVARTIIG